MTMRATCVAAALLATAASASPVRIELPRELYEGQNIHSEEQLMQSYLRFLARYGKAYATIEGMQERFSVFKHNYKRISSFNSEVDEWGRSPPFKLGINRFSDMTEQEFINERLSSGGAKPHDARQRRRERKQKKQ